MKLPQYKSIEDKELCFPDRYQKIDTIQKLDSWVKEILEPNEETKKTKLRKFIFRGMKEAKY